MCYYQLAAHFVYFLFNDDGSVRFEGVRTDNGAMKRVAGVGYILNGSVHVKGKGGRKTDKFRNYPFVSSYINDTKGLYKNRRIPVIAIESQNGEVYLYPVRLKSTGSNPEVDRIVGELESILGRIKNGEDTIALMSRGFVSEVNHLLTELGAPASVFQVSYGPNTVTQIENIINEMKRRAGIPNVEAWMSDNADVEQIVADNVEVNINLAEEPFIAPILQVDLFTDAKANENEVVGTENEPVQRPEVPAGTEVPFGETTPPEGTTEHADAANEEAGVEGVTTDTFEPINADELSEPIDVIRRSGIEFSRISKPTGHKNSNGSYDVYYTFRTINHVEVPFVASVNNSTGRITYRVQNMVFGEKNLIPEFMKRFSAWQRINKFLNRSDFDALSVNSDISYVELGSIPAVESFIDYMYASPFEENGAIPFDNVLNLFGDPTEASEWIFDILKGSSEFSSDENSIAISYNTRGARSKVFNELKKIVKEFGERYNILTLKDQETLNSTKRVATSFAWALRALSSSAATNNPNPIFNVRVTAEGNNVIIRMDRISLDSDTRDTSSSRLVGKASTEEGAAEVKKKC